MLQISIAEILKEFDKNLESYPDILDAIYKSSMTLAEQIQKSLQSKKNLKVADQKFSQSTTPVVADPVTKQYSKEIIAWSIAILTSAWAEWVFYSKSNNDSAYQTDPKYDQKPDRKAARVNVRIVKPYIRNSILDAMDKGREIGTCKQTNYNPSPLTNPANIELRKK